MQIDRTVSRSALRYFGGKWALAPRIIEHMPAHRVYVEPFGGAASVLLRKPRSKIEVYNDLDDEIVGIFWVMQSPEKCRELFRLLKRTPYARREFEIAFQASTDPIIRAQRAIIRAYMSFHHTALFNPRKNTFANARHRTRSGSCKDALDVIRVQDTDDALFFVDPPYVMSTRSKSACYRHEMSDEQHLALLDLLKSAKGHVMISGYASELYDDTLSDWRRLTRKHYAASGGNGPKERTEVLWISD